MTQMTHASEAREPIFAESRTALDTTAPLDRDSASAPLTSPSQHSVEESSKVTEKQLILNLIAGGFGIGMFSLPWGMAGASVGVGSLVVVSVIALNIMTIMLLVNAAERHQVFDLGAVIGKLPGRLGYMMQVFTNAIVWVYMMLSLIGFFIAMHDSAKPFLEDTFLESRPPFVAAAAVVVLPLCYVDQKYLSFTSTVALLVNIYLLVLICSLFMGKATAGTLARGSCYVGISSGIITMLSTTFQCVIIQMCVLPMYKELENRSPVKFLRALLIAFASLSLIFVAFAGSAYLMYGPTVNSNAMISVNTYSKSPWTDAVQIGMVLVIMAVYPIFVLPMTAPIQNLDLQHFSNCEKKKRRIIRVVILLVVAASLIGACMPIDLGETNVIGGAMSVGIFTSLLPGLAGIFLLGKRSGAWNVLMCILIAGGIAMSLAGLVYSDNRHDELGKSCWWGASEEPQHVTTDQCQSMLHNLSIPSPSTN